MNFKEKQNSFKKRFGILDHHDEKKEFAKFKNRILNIFDTIDYEVDDKFIYRFCTLLGNPVRKGQLGEINYGENIISSLKEEADERRFFFLIETLLSTLVECKQKGFKLSCNVQSLINETFEAIEISEINLSVSIANQEIILHPRGEEVLDNELIEEVFSFLNPESQNHFIQALKFYEQRNQESHIKSADSVRRSIEEFLRYKLENQQGLAANIPTLGKLLKSDKRSAEIRNIITQTFSYLDKYFNDHSKHGDGDIGEEENEFLLYQSGLLMRYINKALPRSKKSI